MSSLHIPFRIAIIDLGTNSIRLDIHEFLSEQESRLLHREKLMVRLGQNVFVTGLLDPAAIERTLLVLERFSHLIRRAHISHVLAYATSALRDAKNKKEFIDQVRKKTGIQIGILSGKKEALLIAKAIVKRENVPKTSGFVDIGGGSTEISVYKSGRFVFSKSLPLGAARLQQVFLQQTPPIEGSVSRLRKYIQKHLKTQMPSLKTHPTTLVGSSGTVKGLLKILQKKKKNSAVELKKLSQLNLQMALMTRSELFEIPGMELKRVDLILAGSLILEECAKFFKVNRIRYTPVALRDGLLDESISHFKAFKAMSPLTSSQIILSMNHPLLIKDKLAHHRKIALELLRGIQGFQHFSPFWKELFLKTAMLYRIGESFSPFEVGANSIRLIKTSGILFFSEKEFPFFELLSLWHEAEDVQKIDLKTATPVSDVFLKVLALLQIHYALTRGANGHVIKIDNFHRNQRITTMRLYTNYSIELIALQVDQHKKLFERMFGTMLTVKPSYRAIA